MSDNDEKIKALMLKVEEQEKALGSKPRLKLTTNGVFKSGGDFFNINTVQENNLGLFIGALSMLLTSQRARREAAEQLGIEDTAPLHEGFTVEEWKEDFKQRIALIQYEKRKTQLDNTKKKLKALISERARTEMELDDIENFLSEE